MVRKMPLLWVSIAFMLGLILASSVSAGWTLWGAVSAACILIGAADQPISRIIHAFKSWRKIAPLPLGFILAAFFLGALRFELNNSDFSPSDLAWYNNRGSFEITGQIVSPPDPRDRTILLKIKTDHIRNITEENETQAVKGQLLAMIPAGTHWEYGDRVRLIGKPVIPPENEAFSYKDYLAQQGIHTYLVYPRVYLIEHNTGNPLLYAIYHLRDTAYQRITTYLPQPEASLLSGILLGMEKDIPEDVNLAFQDTGTTHIIAISGFNIAILIGLFSAFAGKIFSRRWAPLAAVLGIAGYTLLVGAQASVVRAAIMGTMALFGQQIGRRQAGVNTLAFTAAVMAIFNPLILWDVGFQLSFAATLGLILFADRLENWFTEWAKNRFSQETANRLAGPVSEYLLFTLAAQVTTLPIIAYHFGRISFSALLANPLILPPQPLIMILGGAAVLIGLVLPPVGQLLAYLTYPLLAYTIRVVELLAKLPFGAVSLGEIKLIWILLFYGIVLIILMGNHVWKGFQSQVKPAALLIGALLAAGFVWQSALAAPDGNLQITVLNVTDGPAILIQSPTGNMLLINGSSSPRELGNQLGRRLPNIDRKLDALILTSQTASVIQGLSTTLERFPAKQVYWQTALNSAASRRLKAQLAADAIPIQPLKEGAELQIGADAQLRVLAYSEEGTALLLTWKDFRYLIPGGVYIGTLIWKAGPDIQNLTGVLLTEKDLKAETAADWIELNPALIITPELELSPNANTINLLQYQWVKLTSNGKKVWTEVQ